MSTPKRPNCPDCELSVDRRSFLTRTGAQLVAGSVFASALPSVLRAAAPKPKPAEALISELVGTFSAEQKTSLILPYDHGAAKGTATRLGMYNGPVLDKVIGKSYTKPQQELVGQILRSICSDEEGYARISRNNKFDSSGSLEGCGALLFGDPAAGQKYAWVFSGHHLTVRCDGNHKDLIGFGGPMYYGHSAPGYSNRNVFNFQTKSVMSVFDAFSEKQRKQAIVTGSPGEQAASVRFRAVGKPQPGIPYSELTKDQKELVEQVMRDLVSPFRKEDGDEVLAVIKATGGMEKIHLAFYGEGKGKEPWHFWRLEGPGFVWNYRVLDHVHCFVNIGKMA